MAKKKIPNMNEEKTLSNSPLKGEDTLPLREGRGGSFNGIPYAVIINGLLSLWGFKDGNVPEGVRNTTLYKLARNLRYICDFNPAYVQSVLPDWGLSAEEV